MNTRASYFDGPLGGKPNSATAFRVANYWHSKSNQFYHGAPYIEHCIGVAAYFPVHSEEHMLALVHDVIEDTAAELSDIERSVTANVLTALEYITKRISEPYENYLERCGKNPLALRVKIADASYNLAHCFSPTGVCVKTRLAAKYARALEYLFEISKSSERMGK